MAADIGFGGDMTDQSGPEPPNAGDSAARYGAARYGAARYGAARYGAARYVDAEPCRTAQIQDGSNSPLTDTQVERWRSQGFVFVDGLVPSNLVEELAAAALERYPAPGTDRAEGVTGFGSQVRPGGAPPLVFPADIDAFNRLTLDHSLLSAVAQLLDTSRSELRLSQSDLWPKYGRQDWTGEFDNQDQRIHVDYPNHSLVHPAPWDRPEAVEMIVYLTDHGDSGGGTAVVPRSGPDDPAYRWPIVDSPGVGALDWYNDRRSAEAYLAERRPELIEWRQALYDREVQTRFRRGNVLFYRHDTWHRGTPLRPGSLRLAHNLTYRRADAEWVSTLHVGWAWTMYRRDKLLERLIAESSVDQRTVLGFPRPGSPYWVPETVAAVGARYGPLGMDMTPYADAIGR